MSLPSNGIYATALVKKPASDLQDFLLIVDLATLPNEWWDAVNTTDGTRGRVLNGDTLTTYASDWIDFDNLGKTGTLRIHWDGILSSSLDSHIRIFPPHTLNNPVGINDAYGQQACYDGANIFFYSPNGGINERANQAVTLSEEGGVVSGDSAGLIGASTHYDGTDEYCVALNQLNTNATEMTIMSAVNADSFDFGNNVSLGNTAMTDLFTTMVIPSDTFATELKDVGANNSFFPGNSVSTWYHQAGRFNQTGHVCVIDGVEGVLNTFGVVNVLINSIALGTNVGLTFVLGMAGFLQHVLVSLQEMPTDWIKHESDQIHDNTAFWGAWAFVDGSLPTTSYVKSTAQLPSGDVNDFLFVVDLSLLPDTWWDLVDTADGTRGRVANDNTLIPCPTDWIDFNSSTKTGLVRIYLEGLYSSTIPTTLRVYPPTTLNEPIGAGDIFGQYACYDSTNVFMHSPNGGNNDRSSNQFTLTEFNGVVSGGATGKIGKATEYDGVDQYTGTPILNQLQPITFMAWNRSHVDDYTIVMSMTEGTNVDSLMEMWYKVGVDDSHGTLIADLTEFNSVAGTTLGAPNTWNHLVSVFANLTDLEIWSNGVLEGSITGTATTPSSTVMAIGASKYGATVFSPFDGEIGQVFVFTDTKTTPWIESEYDQTNDNSSFWSPWEFVLKAPTLVRVVRESDFATFATEGDTLLVQGGSLDFAISVKFDNVEMIGFVTENTESKITITNPTLPPKQYLVTVIKEIGPSNSLVFPIVEPLDASEGFTQITDHVQQAKNRILHQYLRPHLDASQYAISTQLPKLVEGLYSKGIQGFEDAVFTTIPKLDIASNSGKNLDQIGDIVGQQRNDLNDDDYRARLKGKVAVNTSNGHSDDIYRIWKAYSSATVVLITEVFPAGIQINTDTVPSGGNLPEVIKLIDDSLGAGISLVGIILSDPVNSFQFSPSVIPVIDPLHGFNDTTIAPSNTGGKLAQII